MTDFNNRRVEGISSKLHQYEIWLRETALNLIMEEELPEWNGATENGEEIELDDTFFIASTNRKANILWSVLTATRNAISKLNSAPA